MDHATILKRIKEIEAFFEAIGLKKIRDFPTEWDLDSVIKYEPIETNYTITYKGEQRILINVDIGIMGGILFVLSGKYRVSVFESVKTDYDFKGKYEDFQFFKEQFRNWRISEMLD